MMSSSLIEGKAGLLLLFTRCLFVVLCQFASALWSTQLFVSVQRHFQIVTSSVVRLMRMIFQLASRRLQKTQTKMENNHVMLILLSFSGLQQWVLSRDHISALQSMAAESGTLFWSHAAQTTVRLPALAERSALSLSFSDLLQRLRHRGPSSYWHSQGAGFSTTCFMFWNV